MPTISPQAKNQSVTALRFIRWFCGLWWRDLLDRHKVRFYMKFDLKSNSFRAIRVSDRQLATLATRVQPRRKLTASRTINLPLPTGIICPADQTAPEQVTHHSKTKRSIGNSGPCNPKASPPRPNKSTAPDGNTKLPPSDPQNVQHNRVATESLGLKTAIFTTSAPAFVMHRGKVGIRSILVSYLVLHGATEPRHLQC